MLFSNEVGTDSANLKSEKDYVNFAKRVSGVLYDGAAPYRIPDFMAELIRGIGKAKMSTMDMKKIVDAVTVEYNKKVQEDKKAEGGKKKSKKP